MSNAPPTSALLPRLPFFWRKKQVFTSKGKLFEKLARTNGKTAYLNRKQKAKKRKKNKELREKGRKGVP